MVQGLTFGNSVVCMKSEVQSGLDMNQRTVGHLELGTHGKTTNESAKGNMAWARNEVTEAQGEMRFKERVRKMGRESAPVFV